MNVEQNVLKEDDVGELEGLQLQPSEAQWSKETLVSELIEHILTRFHDVHREQLPMLVQLAQRVERVHAQHPACPAGLWAYLQQLQDELEAHMGKEEQILFPMLSRGMHAMAAQPIEAMRLEHESHAKALDRIDVLTHGATLPAHACNTWQALHLGLETFKTDLREHIHFENNLLFQSGSA